MKETLLKFYMDVAVNASFLSYCKRRQVGAVITDENGENILGYGFNGTIKGLPNICELEDGTTDNASVLHAETNAIMKVCRSTQSTDGAVLFVTLSPCVECAKIIIQAGISKVYFKSAYKSLEGLAVLNRSGVTTQQFK